MIKNTTIFILIFFSVNSRVSFAQKSHDYSDETLNSLDIMYGKKVLNNNFYGQLNTVNNFSLRMPISYVGIGFVGSFNDNLMLLNCGHISYSQIIPDDIAIGSINGKISGFNFSTPILGYNFLAKEYESADFFVSLGFNTGRLRVYGNELIKQKNPYFSPKITISPKVKIKSFLVLSLYIEYEWDISKGTWKRTLFSNGDKIKLSDIKQTGISSFLSLGYVLRYKNRNPRKKIY